jgi:hypothetical protein
MFDQKARKGSPFWRRSFCQRRVDPTTQLVSEFSDRANDSRGGPRSRDRLRRRAQEPRRNAAPGLDEKMIFRARDQINLLARVDPYRLGVWLRARQVKINGSPA